MTAFSIMDLFHPGAHGGSGSRERPPPGGRGAQAAGAGGQDRMVFQDPMSYLDPLMPVGRQIAESLREHGVMGTREVEARVTDLLTTMDLPTRRNRPALPPRSWGSASRC